MTNSRPPYAGDVIYTAKSREYVEVLEVDGYRTIDGMDIYRMKVIPLGDRDESRARWSTCSTIVWEAGRGDQAH